MDKPKIILNFNNISNAIYETLIQMGYAPNQDDSEIIASIVVSLTSEIVNAAIYNVLEDVALELEPNESALTEIDDLQRLYEELQKQESIAYGLRKRITSLKGELKHERQEKAKLLKELKERRNKDHYRNGQKRGSHGRNG